MSVPSGFNDKNSAASEAQGSSATGKFETVEHPTQSALMCRPKELLENYGWLLSPMCRSVDEIRSLRGRNGFPDWPDYCFVPSTFWLETLTAEVPISRVEIHQHYDAVCALGPWRTTQGVYRFDLTLFAALKDTPMDDRVPSEIICRIPEWCIYIPTPGIYVGTKELHGAFSFLDWNLDLCRPELCILLDMAGLFQSYRLFLDTETVDDALTVLYSQPMEFTDAESQSTFASFGPSAVPDACAAVRVVVSLLLYICSENADLGSSQFRPPNPVPKRTKRGMRIYPAARTTTWDVGVRLGSALRRAYEKADREAANKSDGSRASPRAHIRRAHWHHYRVGPRDSAERRLILKWLPPIPVNVDEPDLLPSTIRPVE